MNTDNEDNTKSKGSKKPMQGRNESIEAKEELHLHKNLISAHNEPEGLSISACVLPYCAQE